MTLPKTLILGFVFAVVVPIVTVQAAEPIPLRAGPVSMVFDAENVFLRYIRMGKHELLRGINAPVRNQNWATIAPEVSNLQVEQRDDSFKFKGGSVRQIDTSDNLSAVVLALQRPGRIRVLVGNLTGKAQRVTLRGLSGKPVSIQILGTKKTQATPELSINLPPYGIVRIDRLVD